MECILSLINSIFMIENSNKIVQYDKDYVKTADLIPSILMMTKNFELWAWVLIILGQPVYPPPIFGIRKRNNGD